jgi:hypothetical protein
LKMRWMFVKATETVGGGFCQHLCISRTPINDISQEE